MRACGTLKWLWLTPKLARNLLTLSSTCTTHFPQLHALYCTFTLWSLVLLRYTLKQIEQPVTKINPSWSSLDPSHVFFTKLVLEPKTTKLITGYNLVNPIKNSGIYQAVFLYGEDHRWWKSGSSHLHQPLVVRKYISKEITVALETHRLLWTSLWNLIQVAKLLHSLWNVCKIASVSKE